MALELRSGFQTHREGSEKSKEENNVQVELTESSAERKRESERMKDIELI